VLVYVPSAVQGTRWGFHVSVFVYIPVYSTCVLCCVACILLYGLAARFACEQEEFSSLVGGVLAACGFEGVDV
jgi:hypothetical protein